jgi:opacity protein-like surface antigen
MIRKTLLAVAVTCFAAGAAQADGGVYMFGSIGKSSASLSLSDFDDFTDGVSASLDKKDNAYKLGAGFQLGSMLALELQYTDLGAVDLRATNGVNSARVSAETAGIGGNLVATLPIGNFSLFAKGGYHYMKTDAKGSNTFGERASATAKEWAPSLGVGAGFDLTESFTIVAEYERYFDVADDFDVDLLSAGLRFKF